MTIHSYYLNTEKKVRPNALISLLVFLSHAAKSDSGSFGDMTVSRTMAGWRPRGVSAVPTEDATGFVLFLSHVNPMLGYQFVMAILSKKNRDGEGTIFSPKTEGTILKPSSPTHRVPAPRTAIPSGRRNLCPITCEAANAWSVTCRRRDPEANLTSRVHQQTDLYRRVGPKHQHRATPARWCRRSPPPPPRRTAAGAPPALARPPRRGEVPSSYLPPFL